MESLRRAGFKTVGAGQSREETATPLLWETPEGRLGVINWVFPETHPDWMRIPGPNCWPGIEVAERTIRRLRAEADWVLLFVHWSDEHFPYPRPEDRSRAHELALLSPDLIIGNHPHVVRGMEVIGSCPIFYSIGNFYFSDITSTDGKWVIEQAPRNREGLGVQITFQQGAEPRYQVLSFWMAKRQVILDPLRRAVRRMRSVSQPLHRLKGTEYEDWYQVHRSRFDKWGGRWHFGVRRLGGLGLIKRLAQRTYSLLQSHK
jgi:hypothetical protein